MTKDELISILWAELKKHNSPEALEGYFDYIFEDDEVREMAEEIHTRTMSMPMFTPIHNNDSGFEAAEVDESIEETCFRLIIESPVFDCMNPREREMFLIEIAQLCITWVQDRENY